MKYPEKSMVRAAIVLLALFLTLTTWLLSPPRGAAFTPGKLAPDISGGPWINSQPLTLADLKERVVLVEFWTYG